jgi:hypothetical protein
MTLLSVIKDVCAVVGVQIPTAVMPNIADNRTVQEMVTLANEMAQRIAYDTRDWTMLQRSLTFPCDGTTGHFPLPENFKRLMLNSQVRLLNNPTNKLVFIPTFEQWIEGAYGSMSSRGEWILFQGNLVVRPIPAAGDTVHSGYIDKDCIKLGSGGFGDVFMNDTDTFRLDERLLKLGMIWQWRAQKGAPYAEDMGTYNDALNNVAGRDVPAPIIIGRAPISHSAGFAYPWQMP